MLDWPVVARVSPVEGPSGLPIAYCAPLCL